MITINSCPPKKINIMKDLQAIFALLTGTHFTTAGTFAMSDFSSTGSFNQPSRIQSNDSFSSIGSSKKSKKPFKKAPLFIAVFVIAIVGIIGIVGVNTFGKSDSNSSVLSAKSETKVSKPLAEQELNKNFNFPLTDDTGREVSKIQYEIQSAELRDEIIVKGQRASAVDGRVFLILNIKITNNYKQSVQLNTKDYVRLTVAGSPEKLAADIHNDPVEVQAISTKFTRLGFPIDANAEDLTLQIGEINGKKETVKLNLR